jgi:hypothetical protein
MATLKKEEDKDIDWTYLEEHNRTGAYYIKDGVALIDCSERDLQIDPKDHT